MGAGEVLDDLATRLREKVSMLNKMADEMPKGADRFRLRGKADGVVLALTLVEEARRDQ